MTCVETKSSLPFRPTGRKPFTPSFVILWRKNEEDPDKKKETNPKSKFPVICTEFLNAQHQKKHDTPKVPFAKFDSFLTWSSWVRLRFA
mmetsp:Transcript_8686/g.13107  ORF Transcript_8686/g.13107 Transcript_8686/m.13107 type:complete len:89 (+) Transcript_8686:1219-1485(+)